MEGLECEKKVTKSNYYVRALTYCDMCRITTSDLEDVLDVYPEFANNFLSNFYVSFDLERVSMFIALIENIISKNNHH